MLASRNCAGRDNKVKIPREQAQLVDCLRTADIEIDGLRPWEFRVHDHRLYQRVWAEGSLGAGDLYVEGWWDRDELDGMICRVFQCGHHARLRHWSDIVLTLKAKALNLQTSLRAFDATSDITTTT